MNVHQQKIPAHADTGEAVEVFCRAISSSDHSTIATEPPHQIGSQTNSDVNKNPAPCQSGDRTPLTRHRYERANDRIDPHDHRQPDADSHCCDAMAKAQRVDAPAETHSTDRPDMIEAHLLQCMRLGFNEQHRENQSRDQSREVEAEPATSTCSV